ncbi:acyl-CoA thioesterase [Neisseriaceae bacterium PsAf]|nr:acyl-CoA thioesterase [Neisseriaceae bacterium PsAf]
MREYKKPADSDVEISMVMQPEDTNVAGNIFGGKILSMMDLAAYACSCKHARCSLVTASVDTVNFRAPIHVGDLVTVKARVNHVGRTSIMVGMRVETENLMTGEVRHSNSSYFTMVAMDSEGYPQQVPGLFLETPDEVRRFIRSNQRRLGQKESLKKYALTNFELDKKHLEWCERQSVKLNQDLYNMIDAVD